MSDRFLIILLSLFAWTWAGCESTDPEPKLTTKITKGPLVFSTSVYGELEARESQAIHAPEMQDTWTMTVGKVQDDGTEVKKGDVVLSFVKESTEEDLREQLAELEVAQAEYRREEQQLDKERIDLELNVKRSEMMVERERLDVVSGGKLISQLELEKAELDVERAKLELAQAQKAMESHEKKRKAAMDVKRLQVENLEEKVQQKRDQLTKMDVVAPADGVIYAPYTRLNWVRAKVAQGRVVRPGDKLLEIPSLSAFNVNLFVRQREAILIREGDEATIYPTVLPDHPIKGKVVKKESFATTRNERLGTSVASGNLKENTVTVELEESLKEMRPGGTVRAHITSVLAEDVLLVPLAALDEQEGGYSVELADGTKRKVEIGRSSTTHAEVLSGLSEGDEVVLE